MNIAHLILAHNNPQQLLRLVNRLQHKDADFYIHIDKKTDITPFLSIGQQKNVTLLRNRIAIKWGAYSMIEATLSGFEAILQAHKNYGYINLLSGNDYPLVTTQALHTFFAKHPNKAFTEFYAIDSVWTEAVPRLTKYYFTNYNFKGSVLLETVVNKVMPPRKMPNQLVPVGRSQWFTITLQHVQYIVDYLNKNKHVQRFFAHTWGSDEIVIQTILFNSPYKKDMVNNNLRYIDWSDGNASPKTFTYTDAATLLKSQKLFARKFDLNTDAQILNLLDKEANQYVNIVI